MSLLPMAPKQLATFHHQPEMPYNTILQTVRISSQPGSSLELPHLHGQQCQVDPMLLTQLTECPSCFVPFPSAPGLLNMLKLQYSKTPLSPAVLSYLGSVYKPCHRMLQENKISRDTAFAPYLDKTLMSSCPLTPLMASSTHPTQTQSAKSSPHQEHQWDSMHSKLILWNFGRQGL